MIACSLRKVCKEIKPLEQGHREEPSTKEECLKALTQIMEPNKTPASDGLPAQCYKLSFLERHTVFDYLNDSYNYAHLYGHLSVSQEQGIIKLTAKKDSELLFIKNWWPISLLNCDHKIIAKGETSSPKAYRP